MAFLHRGAGADPQIALIRSVAGMPNLTSAAMRSFGSFTTSVADIYEYYRAQWFGYDNDLAKGVPDSLTTTFVPLSSWGGQFYDRAFVDYQYYAMTGDSTYKAHGDALIASIKTEFWNAGGFTHFFIYGWAHPRSMYIDYMLNGNADSWTAISKFADYAFAGSNLTEIVNHTIGNWDGRAFGRALLCLRWAVHLGAPSLVGNNLASGLSQYRDAILNLWIDPQGALYSSDQFKNKSYMTWIVADALLDDYRLTLLEGGTPDSRILPAIGAMLDYQNNNHWLARWGGLKYIEGLNQKDSFSAGPGPNTTSHLNMFAAGIAWRYSSLIGETSGSRPYAAFGDRLAIEAFNPSNYSGALETREGPGVGKNFNELFTQCFPYLDTRLSTGIAFPTSSRNMLATWTPGAFTLTGSGTSTHLVDTVGQLWNSKTRGRFMVLASKTAGTSGNFRLEVYNSTSPGNVITQRTFTATGTPQWLGYSDEVLVSGGSNAQLILAINDNNDGLGSRTIQIDGVDLGIGASQYSFPAEPVMLELTGTGPDWATDNTNSLSGCNATLSTGATVYDPSTVPSVAVGTVFTINHATYDSTQPAPASFIYRWRRDGKIIVGASSQNYTTVSADSGHYVCGEELPVSAGSIQGRPSQTAGVLVS